MSFLVFVGVYAIGNPVEMLVNPQADEVERIRATAALGLDKPNIITTDQYTSNLPSDSDVIIFDHFNPTTLPPAGPAGIPVTWPVTRPSPVRCAATTTLPPPGRP